MELLQVCPDGVLEEIKQAMERSGYSFFDPICGTDDDGGRQVATCVPVQTPLFVIVQSNGTMLGGKWNMDGCSYICFS